MEAKELDPQAMRTLTQHPAWLEYMKSHLLPTLEWFESNANSLNSEHTHAASCRVFASALRAVIRKPYQAAGLNSPLQRRYEFDEDLTVSETKKGKRAYKKREKVDDLPEIPRRTSFAV